MTQATLTVLDVGHGNCAVLSDSKGVVVIDAGPKGNLLHYLKERKIEVIDVALISHADADHLGGLVALLSSAEFRVKTVRLNTDSAKQSHIWDDLLYELNSGVLAGAVDFVPALTLDPSGQFDRGEIHIEILAPSPYLAGKGPGSQDREGRRISTNSISAVIRLTFKGEPIILFTGDLDHIGLQNISPEEIDMKAPILVFPHHGGLSGSADTVTFARELCGRVAATTVIFSIGRSQHDTPNPAVVGAIRQALPGVRIACTQLSERCAATVPGIEPSHLAPGFARGKERRACCAGSITIRFVDRVAVPDVAAHRRFIAENAPTGLCR